MHRRLKVKGDNAYICGSIITLEILFGTFLIIYHQCFIPCLHEHSLRYHTQIFQRMTIPIYVPAIWQIHLWRVLLEFTLTPRTSDNGDHVFGSGLLPVRGRAPAVRHCRALLFPKRKMRQEGDDVRGSADGRAGNERVSGGHVSGGKLHVGDNCSGSVYNIHYSILLRNCREFQACVNSNKVAHVIRSCLRRSPHRDVCIRYGVLSGGLLRVINLPCYLLCFSTLFS